MKIGSVVKNRFGDTGIVIKQIGVTDRWLIQWASGEVYGQHRCQLEPNTSMKIGYVVKKKGTNEMGLITWVSHSGWRVKYLTGDGEKEIATAWLEVIA